MAVVGLLIGAGVAGAGPASASPRHGAGRPAPAHGVLATLQVPRQGSSCAVPGKPGGPIGKPGGPVAGKAGARITLERVAPAGAVHLARTSPEAGAMVAVAAKGASGRAGKGAPESIEVRVTCIGGKAGVLVQRGGAASGPVPLAGSSGVAAAGVATRSASSDDCDEARHEHGSRDHDDSDES